ncbi:nucleotidyltransferase [Rhodococcus oryzae]|uniref:Nucleotidyltransferase n=1 Tax=Rhodococcus oryzae TaxID=2571143 RepID=A0ABY2RNI2_9NOCA|nr:nucleotidyltransferase [Rhodococcus oryzae]TJZ80029.1 nucleotidyltransferase [Rhodococcus oryzae]
MKLHAYFKHFLENTVNLDDSRIETLNKRVDAISSFLRDHEVFGEFFLDVVAQGSFAQRTIIKPVGSREYDADVLLSLKEHPDWTPAQYTQELYKAFDGSGRYKGMAHRRTRCVYIDYADPFHIDVIPYVESRMDITNNKTNDWEHSDPESFTAWLEGKTRITGGRLPTVLRLLKYLRDSKTTFSVKSVLLTILVGERIESWRTDVDAGHYGDIPTALVNIVKDLDQYLQANHFMPAIWDPAGTGQDFSGRWDQDGYANFRRQIHHYAGKIREAYDEPDKATSLVAWQAIFGTRFQAPPAADTVTGSAAREDTGEQFIDTTLRIPVRISASVRLVGRVRRAGVLRPYDLPKRGDRVGKGRYIDFRLDVCTVPEPYQVYWKVKNTGAEARRRNQLRGQVRRGESSMYEHTEYIGGHYVEVYIVKDGVCVARDRQQVIVQPGMGG